MLRTVLGGRRENYCARPRFPCPLWPPILALDQTGHRLRQRPATEMLSQVRVLCRKAFGPAAGGDAAGDGAVPGGQRDRSGVLPIGGRCGGVAGGTAAPGSGGAVRRLGAAAQWPRDVGRRRYPPRASAASPRFPQCPPTVGRGRTAAPRGAARFAPVAAALAAGGAFPACPTRQLLGCPYTSLGAAAGCGGGGRVARVAQYAFRGEVAPAYGPTGGGAKEIGILLAGTLS